MNDTASNTASNTSRNDVAVQRTAVPMTSAAAAGLRLVVCPQCAAPAEVEWSDAVDSTDGPVEVVKIRCLHRHGFLMPAAGLLLSG
jgi:hypothetical protein